MECRGRGGDGALRRGGASGLWSGYTYRRERCISRHTWTSAATNSFEKPTLGFSIFRSVRRLVSRGTGKRYACGGRGSREHRFYRGNRVCLEDILSSPIVHSAE